MGALIQKILIPFVLSWVALLLFIPEAGAQWSTITHKSDSEENGADTTVAYTINQDGYTLEIYIDKVNAVRSRFSLPDGLLYFADKFCPTFQIDRGMPLNRSINDAPCISSRQWVEYVIGHADGSRIASASLLALMNGITITYRFKLANNDYRSTTFSLAGSKRAMNTAFGETIVVTESP